ncbi:MAG: choice-of-anchor Q domain-containing protein [Bacteroidota bacterium]
MKIYTIKVLKQLLTIAAVLFSTSSFATDYTVSGASSSSFNGTYVQSGTCNSRPAYIRSSAGTNYAISFNGSYWRLGTYSSNKCTVSSGYFNFSSATTCPLSGWGSGITIEIAAPKLIFSSTQFVENSTNNGIIATSITITHNNFGGATFAGSNGDNFVSGGKVAVYNIPSGLTASILRNNNLSLTFTLTGAASAHANANDINNLNVVFANGAFSNNNASNTVNSNSNFGVNFIEVLTVGSGNTYATIQSAVNAATNYDVLSLAAQTFTESGININNKSLTILGQSPTQTIVQANANPGVATDRVFNISFSNYSTTNVVNFEKLTIRNGNAENYGGGVLAWQVNVNFLNCSVESNYAYTTPPDAYYGDGGGAIRVSDGSFSATGTTFYNNRHNSVSNRPGDFMGGGAVAWFGQSAYGNTMIVTNCTFSNNTCGQYGAAILIRPTDNDIKIINSTFNGNSAGISGGVTYFGGASSASSTNFINSIFYGNTAVSDGPEFASSFSMTLNATNCIIDNNTNMGSISGNFVNCIIAQDPLLGALSDNGGYTKTFALTSGSPAIDAGATSQGVPLTDQRGASTKNTKDIGSYEYCPSTSSITIVSICSNALPYTWNGVSYATSGTKIFTTTNSQGCDSVATLNLTIKAPTSSNDSITINSSQLPYSWNGLTFNGAGTQTAYLTNVAGCDSAATLTIRVSASTAAFNLKAMLQGLYLGNGKMIAAPFSADGISPMNIADTITVELRANTSPFSVVHTIKGLLDTAGNATITFPSSVNGNSYYVVVGHRNSIPAWSTNPVTFSATTNYDFTSSITKAFGSNMADDGAGVFMLFSGDINQDGSVDFSDYPDLDISSNNGDLGYYVTDLNGDASVDFSDYPTLDINSNLGVLVVTP